MTLLETALRASWPALMATRSGRQLPGRIARALGPSRGPAFLAAVKRVNAERLARAEAAGSTRFDAYPSFVTVAGTSRCNIRCEFCINQWDAKPDGSNRPHMADDHVERIVKEVFPYLKKLALSASRSTTPTSSSSSTRPAATACSSSSRPTPCSSASRACSTASSTAWAA
jgi:hypothetical protein